MCPKGLSQANICTQPKLRPGFHARVPQSGLKLGPKTKWVGVGQASGWPYLSHHEHSTLTFHFIFKLMQPFFFKKKIVIAKEARSQTIDPTNTWLNPNTSGETNARIYRRKNHCSRKQISTRDQNLDIRVRAGYQSHCAIPTFSD